MLRYYIARQPLPIIQTHHATPFSLESSQDYKGKVIPFSHIYVTSDPYSRRIKKALGDKHTKHLEELNSAKKDFLLKHARYPIDFKLKNFASISQMRAWIDDHIGNKNSINIVISNGIGTGYGDNYVGLGILQRLSNLLAPTVVNFHLMQTMNERSQAIYMRTPNVFLHNNCMSIKDFFKMDLIINLTGMLGFPEFEEHSLARFHAHMFSINQLIPKENLQPRLDLDQSKVNAVTEYINKHFDNGRQTILLHPQASSPLRTMPLEKAQTFSNELIKAGYNVVCAFPYKNHPPFKDCLNLSKLSRSIDDLIHIIAACDGLISVGTVAYHLGAALGKPVTLLATVRADLESAKKLPEVMTWLPEKNKQLIINKHKSRDEDDLSIANKIWHNVDVVKTIEATKAHMHSFSNNSKSNENSLRAPNAPTKVGVVIPHFGSQEKLNRCLDALVNVSGFDPAYLYIIDNNKHNRYFTVAVNEGAEQALNDGCDYIWILNNDTAAQPDYLNESLKRFAQNKHVGIVGGKNLKTAKPDRIFWGGSYNAFPSGQHKAGYVSRGDLCEPTRESWATFSSVVIRAQTYRDVGGLDSSMRMIFSDSDFCFSAAQKGWQTWYEPKAVILHDTGVSAGGANKTLYAIFRQDKEAFIKKWQTITKCNEIDNLQTKIFQSLGFTPT